MSEKLLIFVKTFLLTESNPGIFADEFMAQWKKERDNGKSLSDNSPLSEALSSIFCLADMYNPDDGRESYELDDIKLKTEIRNVLRSNGFDL